LQQANGQSSRKIYLIGGVALLLLIVSIVLFFALSNKSLGNYNGSLSDLFPDKIGDFKKVSTPSHWKADAPPYLKVKDSYLASYQIPEVAPPPSREKPPLGHCDATLSVLNFFSTDEAKEGMKEIRRQQFSDTLGDGKPEFQITEGSKKKGLSTVGDRFEIVGNIPMGRVFAVMWTNGSVLFFLKHTGFPRTKEQEVQCEKDIRDFESSFSY